MKKPLSLFLFCFSAFIYLPNAFALDSANNTKQGSYLLKAEGVKVDGGEVYFDMNLKVKLWTLMGEPVNECVATWNLRSVHLDNQKTYRQNEVPAKVWKQIEIVNAEVVFPISTTSLINDISSNYSMTYLPCDLGALNASGDKKFSLSPPESSSWDKLLTLRNDYSGDKTSMWVDQANAKKIVSSKLTNFKKEPLNQHDIVKFNIDLSALQEWAQEHEKEKQNKEPDNNSIWDQIDEQVAGPEIEKKLSQLRSEYRKKAYAQCQSTMNQITSCYQKSNCAPKSDTEIYTCFAKTCGNKPNEQICNGKMTCPPRKENNEDRRNDGVTRYTLCFPTYCDGIYVDNPKYIQWKSCTDNALECKVDNTCIQKCNPNGYSNADQCTEQAMSNAPTYENAKKLIKDGWKKKASQPKPSASQPTNFLD